MLVDGTKGQRSTYWIILRPDLADQVKSVADLRGRPVALNGLQSMGHANLVAALKDHGLDEEDIRIETMGFGDMLAALANGAVDAALEIETFVSQAESRGIAVRLYDMSRSLPGYPGAYLFYGAPFITERPDVGKRFLIGYVKALRYLQDAFQGGRNRPEAYEIMIANTGTKDLQLWEVIGPASSYETDAKIDFRALSNDQDFYIRMGYQKQKLDDKQLTDPSFGQAVLQALGPYRR